MRFKGLFWAGACLSFASINQDAWAWDRLPLGPMSQLELDRIGEVLIRCGARSRDGKSEFIEEVVKKGEYYVVDDAINVCDGAWICNTGRPIWIDPTAFSKLTYRERSLKLVSEKINQLSLNSKAIILKTPFLNGLREALPLVTEQYYGKATSPSPAQLQSISRISEALQAFGLADPARASSARESCMKGFQGLLLGTFHGSAFMTMPLHEKEKIFDERARQGMAPDGLLGDSGDTLLWTGIYIASQSYRYRVTGDDQAIRNIEPALWAFHTLYQVTGTRTLIARRTYPYDGKALEKERWIGAKGFEHLVWRSHVSWDMYLGYLYGLAESWDVIKDPKLRDALREDIRQITLGFIADGYAINAYDTYLTSDPDGCFTDHRHCSFWEKLAKNLTHHFAVKAGNVHRALVMLLVAGYITQDPEVLKGYQYLIDNAYWRYARDFGLKRTEKILEHWATGPLGILTGLLQGTDVNVNVDSLREDVGSNLGHITYYLLARLEKDPAIRGYYLQGFRDQVHPPVRWEQNSFWNLLFASHAPDDALAIRDGIESLHRFPLDTYEQRTNSTNPAIPKYKALTGSPFDDKGWEWYSFEPLPVDIRPMHGFAWQNIAYKLDGNYERAAPGASFLIAYWLGRHAGFIGQND